MTPITTSWTLDSEGCIEIKRKGFGLVPDFSSTIHSATGQELSGVLPDLGAFADKPNYAAMMRGYIALSRVKDAEGLLVVQPFSPMRFA